MSLKYYLPTYPNGIDTATCGQFDLQINLVSIASYNIYCHELNHCFWGSSSNHKNFAADGKITKCTTTLPLNSILYELNRIKSLTFYCTLVIAHEISQNYNKSNNIDLIHDGECLVNL